MALDPVVSGTVDEGCTRSFLDTIREQGLPIHSTTGIGALRAVVMALLNLIAWKQLSYS